MGALFPGHGHRADGDRARRFHSVCADAPGGVASIPALLHIHGAVFLGWFIVYCVQASLIGSGNARLHTRLGLFSLLLAAAMVTLGLLATRSAFANPAFAIAGMSVAASVVFPFTDVLNFVIAYGLGLARRRSPDSHKRLMWLAGILISIRLLRGWSSHSAFRCLPSSPSSCACSSP